MSKPLFENNVAAIRALATGRTDTGYADFHAAVVNAEIGVSIRRRYSNLDENDSKIIHVFLIDSTVWFPQAADVKVLTGAAVVDLLSTERVHVVYIHAGAQRVISVPQPLAYCLFAGIPVFDMNLNVSTGQFEVMDYQ